MMKRRRIFTVFLRYGLGPKVFLHSDGIISASLDPLQNFSQTLCYIWQETYVLSFATIKHETPWTVPTPVMIPPAGTSSPEYNPCPANEDSSRNGVPASMRAVIRLQ